MGDTLNDCNVEQSLEFLPMSRTFYTLLKVLFIEYNWRTLKWSMMSPVILFPASVTGVYCSFISSLIKPNK